MLPTSIPVSSPSVESIAMHLASVQTHRHRWTSALRWGADGLITAAEAIGHRDALQVMTHAGSERAELVGLDPSTDVALLRMQKTPQPTDPPIWAQGDAHLAERIVVVGREPRGPTATPGTIRLAGEAWTSRRGGRIDRRIELEVSWHPSMEGAAVLNDAGALIGMSVPGPRGRVLCIPIATIERVAAVLATHGHIPQPYLGVRLQAVALDEQARAELSLPTDVRFLPLISSVEPQSPAALGGVRLGDWVLGANGHTFGRADDFVRSVAACKIGDALELALWRDGAVRTLTVTIGQRTAG